MLVDKKNKFDINDIKEISVTVYYVFIGEFKSNSDSESDSDSDLPDFDSDEFGCGEISSEIETFVETNWKDCDPLDSIYGTVASNVIKETVKTADEETRCAGIKLFNNLI